MEKNKERSPLEPKLSRRGFLQLAAGALTGAALNFAPRHLFPHPKWGLEAKASSAPETLALSSDEIIQQGKALELAKKLFEEGEIANTTHIGWVDMMPTAIHKAYPNVLNILSSKSFARSGRPFNNESGGLHGTMALQFATQENTVGKPGLSQNDWSEITFTNLFEAGDYGSSNTSQAVKNYVAAIQYLMDQGATVIGTMPTWRDSDFSDQIKLVEAYKEIRAVFREAQDKNVMIVIPAGNANANLATARDKRVLHEIAKEFDNVLVVGGVDENLDRAQWPRSNGSMDGSNYGKGCIDIFSVATSRVVPVSTSAVAENQNGTTYCTGDVVSLIGVIQNIVLTKTGELPNPTKVLQYMTETGQSLPKVDKSSVLIQMENTIRVVVSDMQRDEHQ